MVDIRDIKYDYSELRGRIVTIFGTNGDFGKAMGMSSATISYKLTNKSDFTQSEISKAVDLLKLDKADIGKIFFTEKIEQTENQI